MPKHHGTSDPGIYRADSLVSTHLFAPEEDGLPLLVRTTLGVRPDPAKRELESAPLLPREFSDLRVKGVPAFGKRFDVPT